MTALDQSPAAAPPVALPVMLPRDPQILDACDRYSALEAASLGGRVLIGHAAENVVGVDVVVRSTAVADDNPEVVAAHV